LWLILNECIRLSKVMFIEYEFGAPHDRYAYNFWSNWLFYHFRCFSIL